MTFIIMISIYEYRFCGTTYTDHLHLSFDLEELPVPCGESRNIALHQVHGKLALIQMRSGVLLTECLNLSSKLGVIDLSHP